MSLRLKVNNNETTHTRIVSLAAVFWMSRNAPKRALRDIQNTAARETNTRNDRIKNARAQCTAVILFDFSSFVRQTSGKKQPLFESKQQGNNSYKKRPY